MKSLLKKIILFLGFLFHRNHRSKVIYYHDVSKQFTDMGTDFVLMQKHFDIIHQQGYNIVSKINKPKFQVTICFDDGWAGIYNYKEEFLKKKIFPTIFIAVSLIGKEGYLTISQIKELIDIGFHFQAHTWSHEDLTTFNEQQLNHELKDSKEWLERTLGNKIEALCFPMGRFSLLVKTKSLEFGYKTLYTSLPGGFFDIEDGSLVCRNCAQSSSPSEFKWMLNGASWVFKKKLFKQHFQK